MNAKLTSYDPCDGEPIGEVEITPPELITRRVDEARRAQPAWADMPIEARAQCLLQAAEVLNAEGRELGQLLSREMGKPTRAGLGEVFYCASSIVGKTREIIAALKPRSVEDDSVRSIIYQDPLGVCAAIAPWNYPMSMPQWLVLPALMAGNSVVLKPSEETPLIAQAYVDILNRFLPPGVLSIVHGADQQGKALVQSDVDLIAFTGSLAAGRDILSTAAPDLKRVILELGGKDAFIVLPGADLDHAAAVAVENGFENAGQMCVSVERVYVHASQASEFESKLAALCAKIKVGSWRDAGAELGPMINVTQRAHVLAQMNEAIASGARVVAGGGPHPERFVLPTILAEVNGDMRIMREETFGPVLCLQTYQDTDEAIALANASLYGLGATVFGPEPQASQVARRLQSGMIGVNKSCFGADGTPWVGAKHSGYGFHGSAEGHRQFTQTRVVSWAK